MYDAYICHPVKIATHTRRNNYIYKTNNTTLKVSRPRARDEWAREYEPRTTLGILWVARACNKLATAGRSVGIKCVLVFRFLRLHYGLKVFIGSRPATDECVCIIGSYNVIVSVFRIFSFWQICYVFSHSSSSSSSIHIRRRRSASSSSSSPCA